jgi:hypothetical protein
MGWNGRMREMDEELSEGRGIVVKWVVGFTILVT